MDNEQLDYLLERFKGKRLQYNTHHGFSGFIDWIGLASEIPLQYNYNLSNVVTEDEILVIYRNGGGWDRLSSLEIPTKLSEALK